MFYNRSKGMQNENSNETERFIIPHKNYCKKIGRAPG